MGLNYRNFYVLGDSLSDNGALIGILNHLSFAKSVEFEPPFYLGRSFSNGPVAAEYVAKYLGLEEKNKPGWKFSIFGREFQQQGQNYAVAHATAAACPDPIYSHFFNQFRLVNQLHTLIEHHPDISQEDLFLIMIGGNDIMAAATYTSDLAKKILEQSVNEIGNTLKILYQHNVQHVIVTHAPNIGLIPAFNKNKESQTLVETLTNLFNTQLIQCLKDTQQVYPNLKIKQLDLNVILKDLIDAYKIKGWNYEDACLSDVSNEYGFKRIIKILCELIFEGKLETYYNPGCSEESLKEYLFFDFFHPTAGPHKEIGDALCKLI